MIDAHFLYTASSVQAEYLETEYVYNFTYKYVNKAKKQIYFKNI